MKTKLILAAAAALVAICGCDTVKEDANAAHNGEKKLRIAVIPKGATHEFWKSVHEGANRAGEELGVEIVWKGPLKEDDRESQIKVVEDFTTAKVDGIVLAPLDDTALRGAVGDAVKTGIPVLIIDSDLKDSDTVSFVATDNEKGGYMAGEHMSKLLSEPPFDKLSRKRRVVMLRYQEGSASTMFREKGFMDAMAKDPSIEVVSSNQYGGATTETAQKAAENLLAQYKNPDGSLNIDGIFTPNESTTFGMLRVLQDNNWAGKVKFVGFDASAKLIEGLEAGQIDGLILQNPREMGYMGVKMLVQKIKGGTVDKRIDTGATLVTKENMKEESVAKLLAPPKE